MTGRCLLCSLVMELEVPAYSLAIARRISLLRLPGHTINIPSIAFLIQGSTHPSNTFRPPSTRMVSIEASIGGGVRKERQARAKCSKVTRFRKSTRYESASQTYRSQSKKCVLMGSHERNIAVVFGRLKTGERNLEGTLQSMYSTFLSWDPENAPGNHGNHHEKLLIQACWPQGYWEMDEAPTVICASVRGNFS